MNVQQRKVQIGKNGGRYEWRVSKETGRRYKKYLFPKTHVVRSRMPAVKGYVFIPNR